MDLLQPVLDLSGNDTNICCRLSDNCNREFASLLVIQPFDIHFYFVTYCPLCNLDVNKCVACYGHDEVATLTFKLIKFPVSGDLWGQNIHQV